MISVGLMGDGAKLIVKRGEKQAVNFSAATEASAGIRRNVASVSGKKASRPSTSLRVIILPMIQPRRAVLLIQRRLAKRLQFGIFTRRQWTADCGLWTPAMPGKNPFRVGINHKAAAPSRIKQHAVRRLRPDAVDRQQPLAHGGSFACEKSPQIAAEFLNQHAEKRPQAPRLDVEISGGPDQLRQFPIPAAQTIFWVPARPPP